MDSNALPITDTLFLGSLALLAGTTLWTFWRTRGRISLALLLPAVWLAMLVLPIALRPHMASTGFFEEGYRGTARDHLYVTTSIANLAFAAFQGLVALPAYVRAQSGVQTWVDGRIDRDEDRKVLRTWYVALLAIAIGLAIVHWSLMPRVPALDVVFGSTGSLQPQIDRENAAKLLPAPAMLKYTFTWNSRVLLPLLFAIAVLLRWRLTTLAVGLFGLAYLMSPLEKFPATLFVLGPFVALVVAAGRPIWSRLMIAGLVISLAPAVLITMGPSLSAAAHTALHLPVSPSSSASEPSSTEAGSPPTSWPVDETPASELDRPGSARDGFRLQDVPAVVKDLTLRRVGTLPADVSYAWFSYFPAEHPFLAGSGWAPWNVLSSGYQNPANLVGLWAFYGRHGYTISSIAAYGPFTADGWAEFGYIGVVIGCVGLIGLGLLIELMRSLVRRPFCLACYTTALVLFAFLPTQSGLMAIAFSSGLFLLPLLCAGYLASLAVRRPRRLEGALEASRATS